MAIKAGSDGVASDFDFLLGVVLPYAGSTAPASWALCYGQAISRTTYVDLFNIIGTTFGVGDGSTTFNVPDMRGNLPLGKDNMGGTSRDRVTHANADVVGGEEGAETHILTVAELAAHTHGILAQSGSKDIGAGAFTVYLGGSGTTASTGGDTAHENMSPYMTLNYIIKVTA